MEERGLIAMEITQKLIVGVEIAVAVRLLEPSTGKSLLTAATPVVVVVAVVEEAAVVPIPGDSIRVVAAEETKSSPPV